MNELAEELAEMMGISYSEAYDELPILIKKGFIKMLGGEYSWTLQTETQLEEHFNEKSRGKYSR